MNEGWRCPVCGAGVAPTEKRCDHGEGNSGLGIKPKPPFPSYPPNVRFGELRPPSPRPQTPRPFIPLPPDLPEREKLK